MRAKGNTRFKYTIYGCCIKQCERWKRARNTNTTTNIMPNTYVYRW